jgi:hypothetical protein
MSLDTLIAVADGLDVPTLALAVVYGFFRVIKLLHAIELRLVAVETRLHPD